jgi:hypothetical protein
MALPLDFLTFVVIFVLTLTLLLTNYVFYLRRGRRYRAASALLAFVVGGALISVFLGTALADLGQDYGTAALLARWGFTFGWAFLLALAAGCVALFERGAESKISISLNVVATLLLGFALVGGLIFSGGSLPPLPASILNLGLAAVLTAAVKWVFDRRRPQPKTFWERLADPFRRKPPKKTFAQRLTGLFRP